MSESQRSDMNNPVLDYSTGAGGGPKKLRLGGALGIAGCVVGLAILLSSCAGFGAALTMSFIPLLLGVVGFIIAVVGAVTEKQKITEDTHVLAAFFATWMSIIGGLVEMAARNGWETFHH